MNSLNLFGQKKNVTKITFLSLFLEMKKKKKTKFFENFTKLKKKKKWILTLQQMENTVI